MLFVVELEWWAFTLKAVKQTFLVSLPVTSSSYLVVYRFLERVCLFCLILAQSFIRTTGSARLAIPLFICSIRIFFSLY